MPIDPVCHMTVEEETAAAKAEYQGKTYYFYEQRLQESVSPSEANHTRS